MVNLTIEQDGDFKNAVYMLQPDDRIDNLTLGMLVNNNIKGTAPVSPVRIRNDRYFQYEITEKVTMREYLGEAVRRDKLLQIFLQIAETMLEAEEYMIKPTSFLLDEQNIYVDENTGAAALICIPLLSVVNDGNMCGFFKKVLFSCRFDLEEDSNYVGRLITLLNPETYSLSDFIEELQNMQGKSNEEMNGSETVSFRISEEKRGLQGPGSSGPASEPNKSVESESEPEHIPFLIRSKTSQKIRITKDEFLIGSEQESVDCWIDDNQTISRKHARIVRHEQEYFVVDNDSRNHTYLNGVLVESGEEHYVPHGAMLRFADEDFEFKMHE